MANPGGLLSLPKYSAGLSSGSTALAQIGTGESGPGGVESVFEYNGLYLNDRSLVDTYIVNNITGLDDADIRDSRLENPARHGETYFNAYYGGRTITISGIIRAHTIHKLRDMIKALRLAFGNISVEYPLGIRTGNIARDSIIFCKKSQKLDIPESQNNFQLTRPFQITLRASDPRIYSYLTQFVTDTGANGSISVTAINNGNYETPAQIDLTGPLTNPVVSCQASDGHIHTMSVTTTIPAGQTWRLDGSAHTFKNHLGVSQYRYLTPSSEWIHIHPGSSIVTVSATGITSASAISLYYRNAII